MELVDYDFVCVFGSGDDDTSNNAFLNKYGEYFGVGYYWAFDCSTWDCAWRSVPDERDDGGWKVSWSYGNADSKVSLLYISNNGKILVVVAWINYDVDSKFRRTCV